jgi:hypothetical protein
MEFTYYGDLLGVSAYYRLGGHIAHRRLNDFYNITFDCLSEYCRRHMGTLHVQLFSDSLLAWGKDALGLLHQLQTLQVQLVRDGLLLRGAMVKGRLTFEPRIELPNLTKRLPEDDTLARAVGLASTQKGARLLVESSLARHLLRRHAEWQTRDGYLRYVFDGSCSSSGCVSEDDILRRLCPTPDGATYELLYFWLPKMDSEDVAALSGTRELLEGLEQGSSNEISPHYRETLRLLQICEWRRVYTESHLGPPAMPLGNQGAPDTCAGPERRERAGAE